MENSVLNLMAFLLKKDRRIALQHQLKKVKLDVPFDDLLEELFLCDTDLSKNDFINVVKDKLNSTQFNFVRGMPESVTSAVGFRSLKHLRSVAQLGEVADILKGRLKPETKLSKIQRASDSHKFVSVAQSKLISKFTCDQSNDIFKLFYYGLCKEELAVLCAFSGRGKTTVLLSLLRDAIQLKLKTLFVSIQDFSESMLKERLDGADEFPDFYACCAASFGIPELEIEVDALRPDIVFLDYLSVMSTPLIKEKRFQLEYVSENLKKLAQEKNILIITAHQLNADVDLPTERELLEAKAGLLAHTDLVLGIGGDMYDTVRNITTIKSRRAAPVDVFKIDIDFANLKTFMY
jgi:predicted ATP-dependent serine protease|tara:strand:- start:5543 stop:6589 length:1047 start_codon:yes stop_codon:yes gene_type:complete